MHTQYPETAILFYFTLFTLYTVPGVCSKFHFKNLGPRMGV